MVQSSPQNGAATAVVTAPERAPLFATPAKQKVLLGLVLVAATLLLYNPVTKFDFVNYDDIFYVTQNDHVQGGLTWTNVKWAFTTFDVANWHPLTWISHMADYSLFGLKPAGHHLMSLFFHGLNVLLLFLVLQQLTGKIGRSFLVALLFAVHPLNVESVAWVSERKNLLSTTFGLVTIGAYGWYARAPQLKRYLVLCVLFACSLMAKPVLVTLPFLLLLLDFWPLGRLLPEKASGTPPGRSRPAVLRLVLEKLPLLALAAASSVLTMKAQSAGGTVATWTSLPFVARLENAAVAYVAYIGKMFWPVKLAVMYPHPGLGIHLWRVALATAALVSVTALVLLFFRRRYPIVGWLWYLGSMVPMIGLIQVGDQAMADRYAYIPLIGLFIALVWSACDWLNSHRQLYPPAIAVTAILLVGLVWQCRRQIWYWQNSVTLFSHALAVTSNNFHAEVNLGGALEKLGRRDEAIRHFYAAAAANPKYGLAYYDIGVNLQHARRWQEAAREYALAIQNSTDPDLLARAHNNLAVNLDQLGHTEEAESQYRQALKLNSAEFNSHFGLASILFRTKRYPEALWQIDEAARILATGPVYNLMGQIFEAQGRLPEAMLAYQEALSIQPDIDGVQSELEAVRQSLQRKVQRKAGAK